ncbi:MAG: outer membrane beta-barrel protein [Bacteroidetes bacterium]|nr:outer membrane beta-barrel protein [Bacteroidota bacterium]
MRLPLRSCLCSLLIMGIVALALPASAAAHDPEKRRTLTLFGDGGDVLRPERDGKSDYVWYIGLDAGLTYSRFQNGPVSWFTPNPYHVNNPMYGLFYESPFPHAFPLFAAANEGDGIGLYFGLTLDFPLNDVFGIVLKGNYHNRTGKFSLTTDTREIHPDTETDLTTIFEHETDWSFNYLGFDLLLRIQPFDFPLYGLIGPSIGLLSSNTAKLTQRIAQPDDIYYTEWVNDEVDIVNEFRSASSEEEVTGFLGTRTDLKLGLGYWIPLTPSLSLVPEIAVAVPLGKFIDRVYDANPPAGSISDDAGLIDWTNSLNEPIVTTNQDFNVITSFITIGLRWHID